QAASSAGNPQIMPAHLLMALLTQNDGIAAPLLEAVGVDPATIRAENQRLVDRLPSASGANSTPNCPASRLPRSLPPSNSPPRWTTNMSPPSTCSSAWPPETPRWPN